MNFFKAAIIFDTSYKLIGKKKKNVQHNDKINYRKSVKYFNLTFDNILFWSLPLEFRLEIHNVKPLTQKSFDN